jgi:hypothetical protein
MDKPDGLPSIKIGSRVLVHLPTARQWLLSQMRHPNPTRGAIERRKRVTRKRLFAPAAQ